MAAHRFPHQSLQELIAEVFVAASCGPHEASVVALQSSIADCLIQNNRVENNHACRSTLAAHLPVYDVAVSQHCHS